MRCPICYKKIIKKEKVYQCKLGHSFDISKKGYVNFTINKTNSGDNKESIKARSEVLDQGYFNILRENIEIIINTLKPKSILDVGCGTGFYLQNLKLDYIYGIDISKHAINEAIKQKIPNSNFFVATVANLPFEKEEVDIIINIFAPASNDFSNIASKYIIKVIPGEHHLIELKKQIYDNVRQNKIKEDKFDGFTLEKENKVTYQEYVQNPIDIFKMTPFYYKTKDNFERKFIPTNITFDFIIRIYKKTIS